jgi:hypothetical protein
LGGELKPELFDEELLNFVGRGVSAKNKPTPVSGWKMDAVCDARLRADKKARKAIKIWASIRSRILIA